MRLPENLYVEPLVLLPANLPGAAKFWVVGRRLDRGDGVFHVQVLVFMPALDGETAEELLVRAKEKAQEG